MSGTDACPGCGTSLQGAPVPTEHLTHKPGHDEQVIKYGRCFCLPYGDITHFGRVIGIEMRGVYDGVLYWTCPDCGFAWARFLDGPLAVASANLAAAHNVERAS